MRNFVYVAGIACANLLMAGSVFKMMSWPGANILLTLGTAACCLLFLPAALYLSYRESRRHLLLHLTTYFVFGPGVLSILFKVLHLPGANILLQLAYPLPFVVFLPVYLYETRMASRENDTNFQGVLFGLIFIAVFSVLLSMNG